MAGGSFNGTTSIIEHTTATGFDVATMTIQGWVHATGNGESALTSSVNRAFQAGTSAIGALFGHRGGTTNVTAFGHTWSLATTGVGMWTAPCSDNAWHAVSWVYDRGLSTNDPVCRVDFVDQTVTEIHLPAGTITSPANGYDVGNSTAVTRTWAGGLMHLFYFSGNLSTADQDKNMRFPGSVTTGGIVWVPLENGSYTDTYVVSGGAWVKSGSNPGHTNITTFGTGGPACETV